MNNVKTSRRRLLQSGVAAAMASQLPSMAWAQDFKPASTVTMVCPYPPGGLGDSTARTVAKGLADLWKVPVVVDTKAGASGMIGAAAVAKGQADGSMLLCMLPEALSVAKALNQPLSFDVLADLQPIAQPVISSCLLAVSAKSRFNTYQDLIQYARANPGKLNFGVQGTGSAFHLAAERWAIAENVKMATIPYKGGAPLLTDLLGGQLDVMFMATALGLPYFASEQLRPLAVAGKDPIEELPRVKTLRELGLRDFEVPITFGVFAPGATAQPILQAINQDIRKVMAMQEVKVWMKKSVVSTTSYTAAEFRTRMAREVAVFTEVAARANIKLS